MEHLPANERPGAARGREGSSIHDTPSGSSTLRTLRTLRTSSTQRTSTSGTPGTFGTLGTLGILGPLGALEYRPQLDGLRAVAYGDVLAVERRLGSERRLLLVNFAGAPVQLSSLPVSTDGLLSLLSSGEILDTAILPAWTSVLLMGTSADESGRS